MHFLIELPADIIVVFLGRVEHACRMVDDLFGRIPGKLTEPVIEDLDDPVDYHTDSYRGNPDNAVEA